MSLRIFSSCTKWFSVCPAMMRMTVSAFSGPRSAVGGRLVQGSLVQQPEQRQVPRAQRLKRLRRFQPVHAVVTPSPVILIEGLNPQLRLAQ